MLDTRHRLSFLAEHSLLAAGIWDAGDVEWTQPKRLIFVCTGNICRSPFAEEFARIKGFTAISCGVDTRSDLPAEPAAIAEASRRGIDLSRHRTSRWTDIVPQPTDIVLATQLKHALSTQKRAKELGIPVVLMSSLLLPRFEVIRDPYGRNNAAFVKAFDLIELAICRIKDLSGDREADKAESTAIKPMKATTSR